MTTIKTYTILPPDDEGFCLAECGAAITHLGPPIGCKLWLHTSQYGPGPDCPAAHSDKPVVARLVVE